MELVDVPTTRDPSLSGIVHRKGTAHTLDIIKRHPMEDGCNPGNQAEMIEAI